MGLSLKSGVFLTFTLCWVFSTSGYAEHIVSSRIQITDKPDLVQIKKKRILAVATDEKRPKAERLRWLEALQDEKYADQQTVNRLRSMLEEFKSQNEAELASATAATLGYLQVSMTRKRVEQINLSKESISELRAMLKDKSFGPLFRAAAILELVEKRKIRDESLAEELEVIKNEDSSDRPGARTLKTIAAISLGSIQFYQKK